MNNRIVLTADEGYVYTNGEIYGTTIYLAENMNADDFTQITREKYEQIIKDQNSELANDEDYQNALRELGVQI